jgi:hypothetical protein
MALTPQIDGVVAIQSSSLEFAQAFKQRVAAGLNYGFVPLIGGRRSTLV